MRGEKDWRVTRAARNTEHARICIERAADIQHQPLDRLGAIVDALHAIIFARKYLDEYDAEERKAKR